MNSAAINGNVVNISDRIETKINRYGAVLAASGVSLDAWEGTSLSGDLKVSSSTLGRVVADLTAAATGDRNVFQLRTAALLRRVHSALKQAAERAEKLERKLSKAKRKAKRRR